MLTRIVQYCILLVLAGVLLAGVLWAQGRTASERCTAVDIEILNADSTVFVTRGGIKEELAKLGIKCEGKPMSQIDADRIERLLSLSEYVEDVQCVKGSGGRLIITVTQIVPVLHVFDGNSSYYVNRAGKRMEANATYYANVPIVEGHFTPRYSATRLLPLVDYVNASPALRALVTMYCVADSDNIYIVPNIYGHVVNVGNVDDCANKFKKLFLFYRKVLPAKGWMAYDTISVKWDHQIVATRRNKAEAEQADYDPSDDEQDAATLEGGPSAFVTEATRKQDGGRQVAAGPPSREEEPATASGNSDKTAKNEKAAKDTSSHKAAKPKPAKKASKDKKDNNNTDSSKPAKAGAKDKKRTKTT